MSSELRVLSYNIRALRDDAQAVSAVIAACQPDVVCVQEAPRFLRWRSKRASVARRAGLVVATADRPAGLMVMTAMRVRVVGTSFTLLPKTRRLHQRAVCSADVVVDGLTWRVASVHFSLDEAERQRHLPHVWSALGSSGSSPLVVAGDVNELPDGPVWRALAERLHDCGGGYTYSAKDPHKRIDGIFVSDGIEVVSCRAVDDVLAVRIASDHLPVLAVLRAERC